MRPLPCSSSSKPVADFDHLAVELAALHGGKPRLRGAERLDLDAVAAPALLARQFAGQPIGERARGGDADPLALEIGHRLDRRIGQHGEGEIGGRSVHGGDPDRRHPFGAEAETRPRADRHIDAVGGKRLLNAGIALEGEDLQVDAFLLEDLGLDADLGGAEGERIGHRLAEPDLVEREARPALQDNWRCQQARENKLLGQWSHWITYPEHSGM